MSNREERGGEGARTWTRGSLYSEVPCLGGLGQDWGGSLYSEVQCIMGNGHMRPPPTPTVDKMTEKRD